MYTSRRVNFWFVGVCGRVVGQLSACENVEVVVGCVSARVAFGSDGCAEDDEVFGYTCGWRVGLGENRCICRENGGGGLFISFWLIFLSLGV